MNVEAPDKLTHAWGAEGAARSGTFLHDAACQSGLECERWRTDEELLKRK